MAEVGANSGAASDWQRRYDASIARERVDAWARDREAKEAGHLTGGEEAGFMLARLLVVFSPIVLLVEGIWRLVRFRRARRAPAGHRRPR